MTLLFVGMTSEKAFLQALTLPPVTEWVHWSGQMLGIFTTLSAAGRRNGRWSACLVPLPNCGKLAGGQH